MSKKEADIYLSIDLDYWRYINSARRFINKCLKSGKPILLVEDHNYLVGDINKSKCTTIINIDQHSDIWDERHFSPSYLDCSNWANFIKRQRSKIFIWWRTKERRNYNCSRNVGFLRTSCGYKELRAETGLGKVPWKRVKRIGIVVSRPWLVEEMYKSIEKGFIANLRKNPRIKLDRRSHDNNKGGYDYGL